MPRLIQALLIIFTAGAGCIAVAVPAARPLIWVTPADRTAILKKIDAQPWARAAFAAMQARVKDDIARHNKSPDAFLRDLPLVYAADKPAQHPTLALINRDTASDPDNDVRGGLQRYLLDGVDCGVLYYLTGDERYARCAADILHATVEAMVLMPSSDSTGNGGWIYPKDHLYEARALGAQLPLIYDFVQPYLQTGATVYDLAAKKQAPFNFGHAQQVFRNYARLAIDHGMIDSNWPVLEMPSLTHNILALDDPEERNRLLEHVLTLNTRHQDSLSKVISEYAEPGSVWPESFQYSGGVSSLTTYVIALLRRQQPPAPLPPHFINIPLSLVRLREMIFPNGESVRFGDGHRAASSAYAPYEIAYALGVREGDRRLQATFGGLINLGIAEGKYDRSKPMGQTPGAQVYLGPLQLLWYAPTVSGEMSAPPLPTTDELPFAGVILQRNLAPDRDPAHALMAVVSGGHHVHAHASGMALELYGAGQVLGANSGKGTYGSDDHENYRRLFAAYNTVIVNGTTQSGGGWANLGMDNVKKIALEPAVGAAPVSPDHSFSLTSFVNDKTPGDVARQERLVGIVRTSATTGYYVDIFRSRSSLPTQFHDYLYHNLGETVKLSTDQGTPTLTPSPGRFVPVPGAKWVVGRSYLLPGWHVFKEVRTSPYVSSDIKAVFAANKLGPSPVCMRLFIPGHARREYSTAIAPATKEAPKPYDKKPTPVLVIRQYGEAWDQPFAVVYEPTNGASDTGSVQEVTSLSQAEKFAGLKVVSRLGGETLTQYVLVQPTATSDYADAALGITFRGRYAVITLNSSGECTSLYLGEGTSLRYRQYDLRITAPTPAGACAEINGNHATLHAPGYAELVLPDGSRVTAH